MKTIFVVDDNDTNLSMAKDALKEHYDVMTMQSAERMFVLLEKVTPDLILLDIEMPDIGGFEALRRLKTSLSYADIPVIFLTGMSDEDVEVRGFKLGVNDYVTKPFSTPVLINRIKSHLHIDEIIRERTTRIERLKNAIVFSFADIVERRDEETGGHIERTSEYIKILVKAMIVRGVHIDELLGLDLESFASSARLHDVGKIAIPDRILNKPGPLDPEELDIMRTHVAEGEKIINQIASRADEDGFLRSASLFAGYHHERWDGTGYPYRLKETAIPLPGRIMAVVDVYDALVSERPYKKALPEDTAVSIIMKESGRQFDPFIVDVFLEVKDQFSAVRNAVLKERLA